MIFLHRLVRVKTLWNFIFIGILILAVLLLLNQVFGFATMSQFAVGLWTYGRWIAIAVAAFIALALINGGS